MHADSNITFHKLRMSVSPNSKGMYNIVRWDTDSGLEVSEDVVRIIQLLTKKHSLRAVSKDTGYSVADILSLMNNLHEQGYIKKIDARVIPDNQVRIKPLLSNVDAKYFRLIFNKPLLHVYLTVILIGISVGFSHRDLFPSYLDLFWHQNIAVVFVTSFLISLTTLLLHELGHFVATRAVGGQASLSVSNRGPYLVFVTESYHLSVLPKVLRYLVYLSGVGVDLLILSIGFILLTLHTYNFIDIQGFIPFIQIANLSCFMQIIWQYNLHLDTDMFNFLGEYLDAENLKPNTLKRIIVNVSGFARKLALLPKKVISFVEKFAPAESDDFRDLTKIQKRHLSIYSVVLLTGTLLMLFQYVFIIIPRELTYLQKSLLAIVSSIQLGQLLPAVSASVVMVLIFYPYLMVGYLKLRPKR